jgi:pimeloyl-ACP methyl ester carboxylesterase
VAAAKPPFDRLRVTKAKPQGDKAKAQGYETIPKGDLWRIRISWWATVHTKFSRCTGGSATGGTFTLDEIASDTLALANELGWGRFSLVGHSMGGKAIQRVLADAPERVTALVGIAPVPASAVPMDEQGTALFYGAADSPDNRRAIIDFTTGNRLTGVWLDAMVRNSLAISTRDAFAAYLDAWAKADFHEAIAGNMVPVLAIVGENDPALGADTVRATWLAWYPNARLEVLANAGHYPMDETPLALVSTMERFLATI